MSRKRTPIDPLPQIVNINPRGEVEDDAIGPGADPDATAEDLDLDQFVAELDQEAGHTYECKVYAIPQGLSRTNVFLFAFAPGQLTLTGLQLKLLQEYGPGDYAVRTLRSGMADGRRFVRPVPGGVFKLSIGARLIGNAAAGANFNPMAIAGGDQASMKFLRDMMEQQRKPALDGADPMLNFIIESNRQTMQMVMGMVALIAGRPTGQTMDPLDQFDRVLSIAQRLNGKEDDDTLGRVLTSAERVLPSLFGAIGAAYGGKPRNGAIPLGAPAPTLDPKLLASLQAQAEAIGQLPLAFKMGASDEAIIDTMIDAIEDDAALDAIKGWAAHPQLVDALLAVVPALKPHAERLHGFVAALRDALPHVELAEVEDEPPGQVGDPANAGNPTG